jgi:serine/threonine-protein kinase
MMTPAYASPEQVRGEAVTTATDVYALGLLLYELLSGRQAQRITSTDHWEVQRAVCERDPERPATVLTHEVAEARSTTPAHLSRALSGDLDQILEMALRKEPERRYSSVAAFAEELRRYREGRPILARGSSVGYRAGKFVRRNARAVAASAMAVVLFLGTVAFYTTRLAAEGNRARSEAARASEVAEFLADLFRQADPNLAPGPPATARDLLDRGAERIAMELQGDPDLRAEMLQVIGVAYQSMGEPLPSIPLLEEAVAIRREAGEAEPLWDDLDALAMLYWSLGRQEEAEALQREALALARGPLADDPFPRATSMNNLGKVLQTVGRFEEAGPLYDSALVLFREIHGESHPTVATALSNQAQIVEFLQGYPSAEPILREAVAVTRSLPEEERLNEDVFLGNLAVNLISQGRPDEAEAFLVEAVALARARFGDGSTRVAEKLLDLGLLSARRGDYVAAEGQLREALPVLAAARGERHPDIAYSLSDLASIVDRQGRAAEADSLHREAVAMSREVLSDDDPYLARALNEYGTFLVRNDRAAAAVPMLSEAIRVATRTLPQGHRFPAQIQGMLGQALLAAGRRGEGIQALQTALPVLREAYGEEDPRVVAAQQALTTAGISTPPPDPPGS